MCVCVFVCLCMCACTHILSECACVYLFVYVCICVSIFVHTHVCLSYVSQTKNEGALETHSLADAQHVSVCVCMCVCTCVCTHTCLSCSCRLLMEIQNVEMLFPLSFRYSVCPVLLPDHVVCGPHQPTCQEQNVQARIHQKHLSGNPGCG